MQEGNNPSNVGKVCPYRIVPAQRMVIEDLRAAYETPWRPSTMSEWSGSESE